MRFRRQADEPAAPAAPEREVSPLAMYQAGRAAWPGDPVTPLELYGAVVSPDYSGWWVYAFADPGGKVWRAGQSNRLYSRWRDHFYTFGTRFTEADKWLIKVANEAQADLIELVLIDFYQPECNDKGRRADLEAKVRRWGRGTKEFDKDVHSKRALDRSKAND